MALGMLKEGFDLGKWFSPTVHTDETVYALTFEAPQPASTRAELQRERKAALQKLTAQEAQMQQLLQELETARWKAATAEKTVEEQKTILAQASQAADALQFDEEATRKLLIDQLLVQAGWQVGLTATPRDIVTHDTYRMFDCESGDPTAHFSYNDAIEHVPPYLAHFEVTSRTTRFLREGIDKAVFNKNTDRKILRNLMENGLRDAIGQHVGKTIIFARDHRHAMQLQRLFEAMYPQYMKPRKEFCAVIDSYVARAEQLIDDFKGEGNNDNLTLLTTAGVAGQFRTPRHVIHAMVEMLDVKPTETVCDPACGTGGFLIETMEYLKRTHSSEDLVHEEQDEQTGEVLKDDHGNLVLVYPVEGNQLEGVVSLPSGVFKPYAGVSTAVLIFTKGGRTEHVWFYKVESDGYSLDDKRTPIKDDDLPDLVKQWKQRNLEMDIDRTKKSLIICFLGKPNVRYTSGPRLSTVLQLSP